MARITVKVRPSSSESSFRYDARTDIYVATLRSPAEKNKANVELLKLIRKELHCEPRIIAGASARKKIIEI